MAIEKGNVNAMLNLEIYFRNNKLKIFNLLFNLKTKKK